MTELAALGVVDLAAEFAAGRATPVDAVEACLDRITAVDPAVNATLTVLAEDARRAAAESCARLRGGTARPLEGIPFGLKDIIDTAGIRTTGGSQLYADRVPDRSATVADRLAGAGAVLVAKLQTFEFAVGPTGTTKNPWDRTRWAGGSSSGSAAAVAARELPFAIGTDTGGSIRIPAGLCGVTGMKPTFGLVPKDGVMALAWTLDHVGPIARSAADCAAVLSAIAGHSARDPLSSRADPVDYAAELESAAEGTVVVVARNWFFERCDPDVVGAVDSAIAELERAGAQVVERDLTSASDLAFDAISHTINAAELASLHTSTLDRLSEYGPEFSRLLVRGQFVSAVDYLHALRARHLVQIEFERLLGGADVLVVPTMGCTAPPADSVIAEIGEEQVPFLDVGSRNTAFFNIVGAPAITVPAGLDRHGLPISMTIAARPHRDSTCLRLAHTFQQRTAFHLAAPSDLGPVRVVDRLDLGGLLEKPVTVATSGELW
jgi:aspartyl-tRNA(Asn)/glutamyl-tRNA(Gln) amidotransferase subunit A